jgi:glycosyltransferase involved in cell wall biosynthesis
MKPIHLLYVSHESWPTYRPDIAVLFGKYLPREQIASDIVTEHDSSVVDTGPGWGGGKALLCRTASGRATRHVYKTWHSVAAMFACDKEKYDAIQVRDMPVLALAGLLASRLKGLPFFYWMSYPQSEGQILRAKARGPGAGWRYWFPLIQGTIGQWLLYRVVLPRADHVFVQSRQMIADVARTGIAPHRMTAVPMGVDLDQAQRDNIPPSDDPRLAGKKVAIYLGTLDRTRKVEMLFQMLASVRKEMPDVVLVIVGDTEDAPHRAWLESEAERLGVAASVIWTGWLPTFEAWRYVRVAQAGLSPFPRGLLLDSASPTKAIEYMALGIPIVVNDNPDQMQLVSEAGCGLCVAMDAVAFAGALMTILGDTARARAMGLAGQRYIAENRSYCVLAAELAKSYRRFCVPLAQPGIETGELS